MTIKNKAQSVRARLLNLADGDNKRFQQHRQWTNYGSFQKKTKKTPKKEIEKAKRLMKEYFNEKRNG